MNGKLYEGCTVRVISCSSSFYWYRGMIGSDFTVIEIRNDWENDYFDVIVSNGNCIDIEDIEFIK